MNLADAGPRTQALIGSLTVIAFAVQGILWGNALINFYLARYREQKLEEDAAAVMSMQAVGILSRLVLYSIVLLLALENLLVQALTQSGGAVRDDSSARVNVGLVGMFCRQPGAGLDEDLRAEGGKFLHKFRGQRGARLRSGFHGGKYAHSSIG